MYQHKEYPKFLYHKTEQAKIVNSEAEQKELGKEWKEVPFEAEHEEEKAVLEKPKKKVKEETQAE